MANFYFTKEAENDIVSYSQTDDKDIKDKLFKNSIGPVIKQLIDNVVQVHNLGFIPNVSYLKEECLLYLISVLNKFDQSKGSKAFNYFTVITKNWFFLHYKKHKNQKYKEINIDDSHDTENIYNISVENPYEKDRQNAEFRKAFLEEVEKWKKKHSESEKVIKVIDALSHIIHNIDDIDFLNKKGAYVYLREISNLDTNDVSISLKKLKTSFIGFMRKWNNGKI